MRHAVMAALFLAAGSAAAFGQDERDKKVEELRREFERTMKGLQQKFELERERLEKEFRATQERLLEKKGEAPDKKGKEPRGVEDLLREILKRVESLEKRLDGDLPRFRQVLPQGMPEEFRRWLEQMPKFKKEEDFRFEFKKSDKPEKKGEAPEKKGEAPDKKEDKKKPQKEEDFRFEFKKSDKPEKKGEAPEKKVEKKKPED